MKRVFSKSNQNIDYCDYLKLKKGTLLLKNAYNDNVFELNQFIDYNTFLTLTNAFYNKINRNTCVVKHPVSIIEANQSYYNQIIEHVNCCNSCTVSKENNAICYCKEIKQILYPYGLVDTNVNESNFYFPKSIRVKEFCESTGEPCLEKIEYNQNSTNRLNYGNDKNLISNSTNSNKKQDPEIDYNR